MVARSSALFTLTPQSSLIVAGIGAFTAILAASIALVQNDIKRVLAYSTVSQLGYMFLAAGVGVYWVAIFHLYTHAFLQGASVPWVPVLLFTPSAVNKTCEKWGG